MIYLNFIGFEQSHVHILTTKWSYLASYLTDFFPYAINIWMYDKLGFMMRETITFRCKGKYITHAL